jgi:hypothetical protein
MVILGLPLLLVALLCIWLPLDSLVRGRRGGWQIPTLIVSVAVAVFLLMEFALAVYHRGI